MAPVDDLGCWNVAAAPSRLPSLVEQVEAVGHCERELGRVDVDIELVHLDAGAVDVLAQRIDERFSASGSWNVWPSVAISETPLVGMNRAVGPTAAFSFLAIVRPSSRHSVGVVRASVMAELCS